MDNTQGAATDGASSGGEGGYAAPAIDKLIEMPEAEYTHHRTEYTKQHGEGAWDRYISGDQGQVESSRVEQKPAVAQKQEAQPGEEEAEDGEIVIDEQGAHREKKSGRFVPKSAYLRVKGEASEAKKASDTMLRELVASKERLALLIEATQPAKAVEQVEAATPIDPKEDLLGAFNQLVKKIDELQNTSTKTATETKAALDARALQDWTMNDARSFSSKTPDFKAAFDHAVSIQEAAQVALGLDEADAKAAVQAQLKALIADAKKAGKSWSERVYNYAKLVGYKPQVQNPAPNQQAVDEIARINNGQNASQTLRGSGSSGGIEPMTRDRVAVLPEAEYLAHRASYIKKNGQAAWDKFMSS